MYDRTWYVTPFSAKASRCGESPRKVSSWGKVLPVSLSPRLPTFTTLSSGGDDRLTSYETVSRRPKKPGDDNYHLYIKFSSARIILPLSFVTCCNTLRTVLLRKEHELALSPFLGVPPLSPLLFLLISAFPLKCLCEEFPSFAQLLKRRGGGGAQAASILFSEEGTNWSLAACC